VRIQSAWPARDLFHEFALGYAAKVEALSAKRLKLDVLAAGSVVPPFQQSEAVHSGIVDGGHGVADLRTNKHKASALFGAPPPFGWDSQSFLAWFYQGGGQALYGELLSDVLRLNVVGFLSFPMPAQPLSWFKKPVNGANDLRGLRYRTSGFRPRSPRR
jgi:TRAP-type mannitol/chloroaromatic compound transport system substrate-binding protein